MAHRAKTNSDKIVSFRVGDKFTEEETKRYAAELEETIAQTGQARVLIIMEKFPKIEPAAFWEDLKFFSQHFSDIERVALVGQPEWEKWYAKLVDMLPGLKMRWFELVHLQTAYDWLGEN